MKRDMELVRSLLLYFEEKPDDRVAEKVVIEGYDDLTIGYHLILLYEAGLIEGEREVSKSRRVIRVYPMRLTWAGHDFIAAARNESIWRKTKAKVASFAVDVPFAVLRELLIQAVRGQLGLTPGMDAL
jgi:DNA-binding transcriptional ArsR family regulator